MPIAIDSSTSITIVINMPQKAQMSFGVTGNVLRCDTLACRTIGHRCHTIGQDLLKKLLKQIDKVC